jgi:hypothetical protein
VPILPAVVIESATAANAIRDDNLASMARQKPDCRLIDLRRENLLCATRQQSDAAASLYLAPEDLRPV